MRSKQITNYLKTLVYWAKDKPPKSNYSFIIEQLGPTVLGIKPSELLNVSLSNNQDWREFKALFSRQKQLGLREIRQINRRQQVIFYHKQALDSVLRKKQNQNFLRNLKYPECYSLDCYLNHLLDKIRSQTFPHEIGIFLGYPLKDVLGFMNQIPLSYVKTNGWRVYGPTQMSEKIHEKYQQARTSRVIFDL